MRILAAAACTTLLALGGLISPAEADSGPGAAPDGALGRPWPGHPDRALRDYRVHAGDTATTIARRFHAWTRELYAVNHKTPQSTWQVGERIVVPIVVSRAQPVAATPKPGAHPRRAEVRRVITRTARRHDVPVRLALAVAWQESGWQQQVRSPVGAVGTMQVMPATGRWLSTDVVGRKLHLRRLEDNVLAGVLLLAQLREEHHTKRALAGYYQGLGSIADNGLYPSTRRYVASVRAIRARLTAGWDPAR